MTDDQSALIYPVAQKTVLFYEDELIAIKSQEGDIYISVMHICDLLGIDRRAQVQRIQRTTTLARGYRLGSINTGSGRRETALLRVDLLPLWLAGLSTNALREDVREKIEKLQDEAAKVLWEAFQEGRLTGFDAEIEEMLASNSPAGQAYRMAQAMLQMARNQLLLERQLQEQKQTLSEHSQQLQDYGTRLEQIESSLGQGDVYISNEQASQISQAVKAIAMKLSEKTKKNEYGGVYGELYRQFGITSYKMLPVQQFEKAMDFLTGWYKQITGLDTLPF